MAHLRSAALPTTSATIAAVSLCLGLMLLHARAEDCNPIRVERTPLFQAAKLHCANIGGKELSVILKMEERLVHNYTTNTTDATVKVSENLSLHVNGQGVWYDFRRVTDSDAGVYSCEVQKIYPPPYKTETRMSALIAVSHCPPPAGGQSQPHRHRHPSGHHGDRNSTHTGCNEHPGRPPHPVTQPDSAPLTEVLWPVCCVMLALLCVVLLVIVLVFGHKLRSDAQRENEYVNTRPADCRRQKGVLRPKWEALLL
ncbi:uncharacterized protein LOC134078839 [Sardina pilchardus]|uniref:uncharacterized protein LOC134078839 n=1 Tax=Sardina pilchardus TaxID=27697 RepID=UPI002E120366